MHDGLPFSKPKVRLFGSPGEAQAYLGEAYNLLYKVRQVCTTSGAPVFAMTRVLSDGTKISAAVVGDENIVACVPAGSPRPPEQPARKPIELFEGIVFEPSEISTSSPPRKPFGAPFVTGLGVEINPPLGTAFGSAPVWLLAWDDNLRYQAKRGNPDNYGCRNWISGEDVLSWHGLPTRCFNWLLFYAGLGGTSETLAGILITPASLPSYSSWWGKNFPSTKVYRALEVILDISAYGIPGVVAGAALKNGALVFAVVVEDFPVKTRFYEMVEGVPTLQHEHTATAGSMRETDWYYSQNGQSAVCSITRLEPAAVGASMPTTVGQLRAINATFPDRSSAVLATYSGGSVVEAVETPPQTVPSEDYKSDFYDGALREQVLVKSYVSVDRFVYAEYVANNLRKTHCRTSGRTETFHYTYHYKASNDITYTHNITYSYHTPRAIQIDGFGEFVIEDPSGYSSTGSYTYKGSTVPADASVELAGATHESALVFIDARFGVLSTKTYRNEFSFTGTSPHATLRAAVGDGGSSTEIALRLQRGGGTVGEEVGTPSTTTTAYVTIAQPSVYNTSISGWVTGASTKSLPTQLFIGAGLSASCSTKEKVLLASIWDGDTGTYAPKPLVYLTGKSDPVDYLLSREAPPFLLHNIGLI